MSDWEPWQGIPANLEPMVQSPFRLVRTTDETGLPPVYAPRLGVDIGQAADYTALAAIEVEHWDGASPGSKAWEVVQDALIRDVSPGQRFIVRKLSRLALGTPYDLVAQTVVKAAHNLRLRTQLTPEVYVDATGVGAPIVDLVTGPLKDVAAVRPVTITTGETFRVIEPNDAGEGYRPWQHHLRVGKAYLVSRLKVLLQAGLVVGPDTAEFALLQKELGTFRARARGTSDIYGALQAGQHDDLVIAVALAVLSPPPTEPTGLIYTNQSMRGPEIMGLPMW